MSCCTMKGESSPSVIVTLVAAGNSGHSAAEHQGHRVMEGSVKKRL